MEVPRAVSDWNEPDHLDGFVSWTRFTFASNHFLGRKEFRESSGSESASGIRLCGSGGVG